MTEQQIIETLATKVMEWHREIHFRDLEDQYGDTYWVDKTGFAVAKDGLWNPLQNIADAIEVAEKLFGEVYHISKHGSQYWFRGYISGREIKVTHAESMNVAIVDAAYQAVS